MRTFISIIVTLLALSLCSYALAMPLVGGYKCDCVWTNGSYGVIAPATQESGSTCSPASCWLPF